jgi:hypothetical protein
MKALVEISHPLKKTTVSIKISGGLAWLINASFRKNYEGRNIGSNLADMVPLLNLFKE